MSHGDAGFLPAVVRHRQAGLSWALGSADCDRRARDRALAAVVDIAAVVDMPVSAGVESGYAQDHGESSRTRSGGGRRSEAADAQSAPLFVNARIDTFLRGAGGVDVLDYTDLNEPLPVR